MPEIVNTAPLQDFELGNEDDGRETMIKVDHVSMVFNMANEQMNNLKEYAIALARRELMFKELKALDDVSLEIRKGDVFGILGTNGSGKSTLLKIVAGVLEPTTGSCIINGNIAPLIELGAGFDLELTARENIYLNGALLGYPKSFIEQNFDDIVSFAEIAPFLDMPMKNYSSGMVARIAFAIATVIVPDILIVDEVLSVGDFMFQQKCERRIMELIKEHDVTVLIVSHNNDQIERLCNKAIWIEKGHPRMMGSARDVCRIYRVLGGHEGDVRSEEKVFKLLNAPVTIPDDAISTIVADDRSASAAKLSALSFSSPKKSVVLCHCDDASTCLVGTALSSAIEAPLLLTKTSALPDVTAHAIRGYTPSEIIVLNRENRIEESVIRELSSLPGIDHVRVFSHDELWELSLDVYRSFEGWGRTAAISWDGCTGDMISLLPYTQLTKAPLFFNMSADRIDPVTFDTLRSDSFDEVLVIASDGGAFSSDNLKPIAQSKALHRFWGNDPYDANGRIDDWIESRSLIHPELSLENLIVSSIWNPYDTLAVGPYALKSRSAILLEDPGNLDSVARAIDYIESKGGKIRHLTFLGDHTHFEDLDKQLLGTALTLARHPPKTENAH